MRYIIKVTVATETFWYSATRGLLTYPDDFWLATTFDSEDGVDVAVKLLQKTHKDWFVQKRIRQNQLPN